MGIEHGSEKLAKALLKKTRGFFNHEKINESQEWIRRQLYYDFVFKVLKSLDSQDSSSLSGNANAVTFVATMGKNVLKDRKQSQLEELATDVQLLCEKLTNH